MVYSKPLKFLVVLILLSFAKGFALSGDWSLTKATGDPTANGFSNAVNSGIPFIDTDSHVPTNLDSNVGCSSTSLDGSQTWSFTASASDLFTDPTEYAFGFWVNFEKTTSDKVFQFGSDFSQHYIVSSTKDGTLKLSFFSDTTTTDPANDISFTVPLNKWLFIAFHFKDNWSTKTLDVILTGTAKISKTSAAFIMPGGRFYFGKSIKGKFHRVVLAKSADISGAPYDTITLNDGTDPSIIAAPCSPAGTCIDSICPQNFKSLTGSMCLSSLQYCTSCSQYACLTCDPDSAREKLYYCQACKDDGTINELKNYHCCAKANHCAECSVKNTQCDVCETGYFLNDDSVASTTSCLSCADSCTTCEPGPECYTCAQAITQTGTTCRVDSVGFEVSFDGQNIVLDFAHPLKTGLSKSSFTATSNSGADIPTGTWTITGCAAGSKQCKVNAPSVQETDLPITLDSDFAQV
ncbi:unnamed protein product [Blepharisma stoltei]|uniref:Uncharacterized protein n=1 Tax=Blepharisma stoltei TaxID=1481888 RepID=A0AAU9KHS4_9CILI|nr:unnamed protein product [Blepharisma stoltei]